MRVTAILLNRGEARRAVGQGRTRQAYFPTKLARSRGANDIAVNSRERAQRASSVLRRAIQFGPSAGSQRSAAALTNRNFESLGRRPAFLEIESRAGLPVVVIAIALSQYSPTFVIGC